MNPQQPNGRSERLFIAIRLPEVQSITLNQHCRNLSSKLEFAKWVHKEDYHITLQFLGDTAPEKIPELIEALKGAVSGMPLFTLSLQAWGTFGTPDAPRVLWAGVDGDLQPLRALQKAITAATLPLGYENEKRSYNPHVSVARKYRGASPFALDKLQLWEKPGGTAEEGAEKRWTVDSIVVFVTRMHKSPMYETVENISFF